MPENMNELNRTLGIVLGKIDFLIKEVKDIRDEMTDSEGKSYTSRASIHRRLDEVVQRTGSLEGKMGGVETTLAEVRETTDQVERWRLMGLGALGITGLAAGSIGAFFATYWDSIVKVFRGQ